VEDGHASLSTVRAKRCTAFPGQPVLSATCGLKAHAVLDTCAGIGILERSLKLYINQVVIAQTPKYGHSAVLLLMPWVPQTAGVCLIYEQSIYIH
jgi:hypothetical protein